MNPLAPAGVRDEQGRSMYFRYYDPRVLGVYLPMCTEEEKRAAFGPVARMMYESETPPRLCAVVAPEPDGGGSARG